LAAASYNGTKNARNNGNQPAQQEQSDLPNLD
jgi:hypothetical protein